MATQITNYQCPACTGPLRFVGESGRQVDEFVDGENEITKAFAVSRDQQNLR